MTDDAITFTDGASYELLMGRWTARVGEPFLDWIAVPDDARWLDVGCGNGAFTELVVDRCRPLSVLALDPSPEQLDYARQRLPASAPVTWMEGDAMQLPVADASMDAAVMALVLFFVPEPATGVAEMCRVVRPGGVVAAYHWDILDGGFPLADISAELVKLGPPPRLPPSAWASPLAASERLWRDAGLRDVRTRQFTVQRRFATFADYWAGAMAGKTHKPMVDALSDDQRQSLQDAVRSKLQDSDGSVLVTARANAITGIRA